MRFKLFNSRINNLEIQRENYINEFRANKDVVLTPCSKFVACFDKLSKGYVLALTDHAEIETMKVANVDDVEFFDGYEIAVKYTDELRKLILHQLLKIYNIIKNIINSLNIVENKYNTDIKDMLNDKKLEIMVFANIIENISQYISITEEKLKITFENSANSTIEEVEKLTMKLINELIKLDEKIIINFISKQLKMMIDKLNLYLKELEKI